MTRRTVIQTLAGAGAIATRSRAAETEKPAAKWAMQFFYDHSTEGLTLNDFRMVTSTFGMAVGWVGDKKGKSRPMAVVTRNAGAKWETMPLPDVGLSVFFVNDSLGWLVGEKALWRTLEGGRDWKKIKLPKDTAINRVYFKDENHGWAVCDHKKVLETKDGAQTWTEVAAAQTPSANSDYTSYDWIEFMSAREGIIVGSSIPPRPGDNKPVWMDPEGAAKRREWPSLTITLETHDGGATWTPQTAPAFGQTTRFRTAPGGKGLALVRFTNSFEWPAEVYLVKTGGGSTRVFRQKDRVVTDCGWLAPSRAVLAAIEPPGRLPQLPVPGKLHLLSSDETFTQWTEMKVDYRAFGTRAMLSVLGPDLAWVATDTGQILRLNA